MVEILILVIEAVGSSFGYRDQSALLSWIKEELNQAFYGEDNFLLYVRNPVKVLVLLIELMDKQLKLTSDDSLLRHESRYLESILLQIARSIMSLVKKQEEARLVLTDTDLKGRDVITLICENEAVDLLEHKYIEKLADEVWDGPKRVNRSLFFLNTSLIAIDCVLNPQHELQDPIQRRNEISRGPSMPRWQNVLSWGFNAWREGIHVRYTIFLSICFVLMTVQLWAMKYNSQTSERSLQNVPFLFEGAFNGYELDGRIQYSCSPPHYEESSSSDAQKYLAFYKAKWGLSLYQEYLERSLQYICSSEENFTFVTSASFMMSFYNLFLPFSLLLRVFSMKRRGIKMGAICCRDITIFELLAFGLIVTFTFMFSNAFNEQKDTYSYSNRRAEEYWEFMRVSAGVLSFMVILMTSLISFRFYFSLKATRLFGPFTKLIKLNAFALSHWLFFTLLILLIGSNFFSILLSENSSCSGLYSCMRGLIEATVGKTDFEKNDGNWSANIALMAVAYILAALLTNMVVAKMNSTYLEVQRKGTLQYYKELFDLRYLYKLDPEYGYLVALEHPFSLFILPTLCIVKCLERRRKRVQKREADEFLGLEPKRKKEVRQSWKCCCCFKCKKISREQPMQLVDFNNAMLRVIYSFYLLIFASLVLAAGLLLFPVGYFSVLLIRLQILMRMIREGAKRESLNLELSRQRREDIKTQAAKLVVFTFTGPFQLLYRAVADTVEFMKICWKDGPAAEEALKSSAVEQEKLLIERQQIIEIIERIRDQMKPTQEEDQIQHPLDRLEESLSPAIRPPQSKETSFFDSLALSLVKPSLFQLLRKDEAEQQYLQEQRECSRILSKLQIQSNSQKLKTIGPLLLKLTIERRPTFPLQVPLSAVSRMLRAYLISIAVYDRIQRVKRETVALVEGGFARKRREPDIRISPSLNNGAQARKQLNSVRSFKTTEKNSASQAYLLLFTKHRELYEEREYDYDARQVAILRLQKIRDGTECVKVDQIEKEEAMEKVLSLLETLNYKY